MFAGNVLGPMVFTWTVKDRHCFGRRVRLLHVKFTLKLFIESFVQKVNDSGSGQFKEPVLSDSFERCPPLFNG